MALWFLIMLPLGFVVFIGVFVNKTWMLVHLSVCAICLGQQSIPERRTGNHCQFSSYVAYKNEQAPGTHSSSLKFCSYLGMLNNMLFGWRCCDRMSWYIHLFLVCCWYFVLQHSYDEIWYGHINLGWHPPSSWYKQPGCWADLWLARRICRWVSFCKPVTVWRHTGLHLSLLAWVSDVID